MVSTDLSGAIRKPQTHRGKKFLQKREPRIYENDKQTLLIKGGHTSQIVNDFLTDMLLLKKPLVSKLKYKNKSLPFEDVSFIERMCNKFDCSLFVFGAHSKKRPNNIIIGRLHDHEILDMYELGIGNYRSIRSTVVKFSLGAKPLLVFSGDAFEENEELRCLKSLLIDMFRGPTVSKVNSSGIEHVIHFVIPSDDKLLMRVRGISLNSLSSEKPKTKSIDPVFSNENDSSTTTSLNTPWGASVEVDIKDSAPEIDFTLRRRLLPSEEKWKRACRVPDELRPKSEKFKNRSMDVFGSKVAQIHVHREHALDALRPGASMRTALSGTVKRGFERQEWKPQKTVNKLKPDTRKRKIDSTSDTKPSVKRFRE